MDEKDKLIFNEIIVVVVDLNRYRFSYTINEYGLVDIFIDIINFIFFFIIVIVSRKEYLGLKI